MAAKELELERIVHISTSEVYGTAQYDPMDERHPQVAQSPYSASKIGADKICQSFHRSFDLPVVIARPFNTYGPRQSGRAVIPSIICQALERDKIMLGSINARRDFNYIDDTASKIITMALSDVGGGKEFNLCSGRSYSIGDIVSIVGKILGKELKMEIDQQRVRPANSEVARLIGDGEYGMRMFLFNRYTPIEEGLEKTIEYFKEHRRHERFTL
jgi:nucleoside-diphosphate-sugar epimerase